MTYEPNNQSAGDVKINYNGKFGDLMYTRDPGAGLGDFRAA